MGIRVSILVRKSLQIVFLPEVMWALYILIIPQLQPSIGLPAFEAGHEQALRLEATRTDRQSVAKLPGFPLLSVNTRASLAEERG